MQEIFILRHGKAEDLNEATHSSDFDRNLTPEGKEKIERLSVFFNSLKEESSMVLSSPYNRAKQTAETFINNVIPKPDLEIVDFLSCGTSSKDISRGLLQYSSHNKILLVGHAPDLETFLGKIIGGIQIKLKKGALAKVTLKSNIELSGELEWLVTTKIVKKLKSKKLGN